jgi:hypothetical protein
MLPRLMGGISGPKDGVHVAYKAEGKGWLVYSGLKGSNVTYDKVIEGCDVIHHLTIEYPAVKKRFYDPLVRRMSRSFRCRPGLESTTH